MMTCESSRKLRSMRTPISHGVAIELCAPAINEVHHGNHERNSVRPTMKPSKRPPDLGGKLAEGANSRREASPRVPEHPAH
jgi:hypothetical protein